MSRRLALFISLAFIFAGCHLLKSGDDAPPKGEAPKVQNKKAAGPAGEPVKGGKVLMVIAFHGYQDKEYEIPKSRLLDAGFIVDTASIQTGTAQGALDGTAVVDMTLLEAVDKVDSYRAVVFVGGPGAPVFHDNETAHDLARKAVAARKVVAAICLAPFTLAKAGVLEGLNGTVWTGGDFTVESFAKHGPLYRDEPVVVDGNVVTANGPPASEQFADALLKLLR